MMGEAKEVDTAALVERLDAIERRDRATRRWLRGAAASAIVACAMAPVAARGLGAVPNFFSAGEVISADEMNANFDHLVDGITAVEARIPPPTRWVEVGGREIILGTAGTAMVPGRTFTFTKMDAASTLRVTHTDYFSADWNGPSSASCQWEMLFNGLPCTVPGPALHVVATNSDSAGQHITAATSTVIHYCSATSAGPIGSGSVTLTVRVTGSVSAALLECQTGINALGGSPAVPAFIAVEELPP